MEWKNVKDYPPVDNYNWCLVTCYDKKYEGLQPVFFARYTEKGWEQFYEDEFCPAYLDCSCFLNVEYITHYMEIEEPKT